MAFIAQIQFFSRSTLGAGIEDEDRKHTWMEDAEWFVGQGAIECARAVYCVAVKAFPGRKGIWTRAAIFEKEYGTTQKCVSYYVSSLAH